MLGSCLTGQIKMSLANTIVLDLPARLESLSVLEACLTAVLNQEPDLSDRDAQTFEVVLAAHETCTNIIEHAYRGAAGRVGVTLRILEQPRRLEIEFHDTGEASDLSEVEPPNLDEAQSGGYGLFLIQHLMDRVTYLPEAGNNRWRLVKHLDRGGHGS
jgi:anti-sigma regulatory factor (Ser/Thr protein kinase)